MNLLVGNISSIDKAEDDDQDNCRDGIPLLLVAPARPNSRLTIAIHKVSHCALLLAKRVMIACTMLRCATSAGVSTEAKR
jgi:hypothetical protein